MIEFSHRNHGKTQKTKNGVFVCVGLWGQWQKIKLATETTERQGEGTEVRGRRTETIGDGGTEGIGERGRRKRIGSLPDNYEQV